MGLLGDIQSSIVMDNSDLGTIFLKLKLLADRLDNLVLENWIKYETLGYPEEAQVPNYRKLNVSIQASFNGPLGCYVNNVTIPSELIKKYCGDDCNYRVFRESICVIDDIIKSAEKENSSFINLDYSNLIFKLQGNVYEDLACNKVSGNISKALLVNIRNEVKYRILDIITQLEKSVPNIKKVTIDSLNVDKADNMNITNIVNKTIYNISTGDNAIIDANSVVIQNDPQFLIDGLKQLGFSESDAKELTDIIESEKSTLSKDTPLGKKAKEWLVHKCENGLELGKAVGAEVITSVVVDFVRGFFGF